MKKVISLCMALMLLLTAFPISANAYPTEYTEPDSCSGTYYNIDWRYDKDTKTMYFTDNGSKEKAVPAVKPDFYLYESSDAAIWAEIDWRPAYPWYSKNTYIANFAEHIVINSSITDVIDYMCYKFTKITEINVPNSVKSIGKSAFSGSTKLENISLPENIEDIDGSSLSSPAYYNNDENWQDNIFYYGDICLLHRMFKTSENTSVKEGTRVIADGAFTYYQNSEITLPESVKIIGDEAFSRSQLERITLPASVVRIGDKAFTQSKIKTITLRENVKSVAISAFDNCSELTDIVVSGGNNTYSSVNGILFSKDKKVIYIYPFGKKGDYYEIPSYVNTVYATFATKNYYSGYLKSLIIPKNITKIVNPISVSKCYYMGSPDSYLKVSSNKAVPSNVLTCKVKQSKTKFTYNGKRKTPRVKVYSPVGKKLKQGTDYKITLPKGRKKIGYYTITVTLKGKYKGKFKVEYRIAPKETSIKKVKTSATTASVKWKKQNKNITGYQLQYSPSESFGALNKVVTLKGKNKTSYKIKNLRIDGIYYVRVRTYKTVKGEKVVSKWSKPKRFRTDIPV